jgi:hypothetical protein
MVELLQEAQAVLASMKQAKDQALQRKEYDRAAELGNREKKCVTTYLN